MTRKKKKVKKKTSPFTRKIPASVQYRTSYGRMHKGMSEEIITSDLKNLYGKVNLIFTSPPFPLNRKKKYGNKVSQAYMKWLADFGPIFKELLTKDGSIVIEMGNSWQVGAPTMSTLAVRALLNFQMENLPLHLCQEFVWYNPARLPSPAQWVNVERIRVKDSFTKLWWFSPVEKPKANNRRVLQEYSPSMKALLRTKKYNAGKRPSEHNIGSESFLTNNGGAIPSNVLTFANTQANDEYHKYCRRYGINPHPARMPIGLADFFIRFLTKPGDLVLDPFGGSNTTGAAAERLKRHWVSIEASRDYIRGSRGRFQGKIL